MLASFSYHIKNRLLLVGAVVLVLLSWNMAFRKTYDAIVLNEDLKQKLETKSDLSINPHYLNQKHEVLNGALSAYNLDSAEWKNEFWLKVSRIASQKEVSVIYNPSVNTVRSDSAGQVAKQEIAFKGDFKKLVTLLDSLEKLKKAGFISSSRFLKEKKQNMPESQNLRLDASFGIIPNGKH